MENSMRNLRISLAVAVLLALASAERPLNAASFDGDWSVVVITEAGECDRAYRYPLRVVNGSIRYEGEAGVIVSGRVDQRGRLSASVQRGGQIANGIGKLSGTTGAGTWSGKSRTSQCSGRWEAEKREG
jgi:hypothetical protein